MKKGKRIMIAAAAAGILNLGTSAYAFRDTDPATSKAADAFIESGLFDSFIFKYGNSFFRPDGDITRSELILVLGEYHTVTGWLLEQNRQILSRLEILENRGLSSADTDMLLREFQRNLEPMLRNSPTVTNLRREAEKTDGALNQADISGRIDALAGELRELENKIGGNITSAAVPEGGGSAESAYDLIREIAALKEDVESLEKTSAIDRANSEDALLELEKKLVENSASAEAVRKIEKEIALLSEDIKDIGAAAAEYRAEAGARLRGLEQKLTASGVSDEEADEIIREIAGLSEGVRRNEKAAASESRKKEKEVEVLKRRKGRLISPDTSDSSVWGKISIGFSLLTLILMPW